ncbi:short-chain dehydrogenase TIC 32, chloroplastic-like isoform X2 [Pyrus x bretschneideri]|uniref:short-chain dehydrogenase TIC 32, chloroplastic-like isoform X2 n=1 Tax=Pyrus x bretschneideri TaxID=225117 RepID=UPI00203085B9|nr:short-chain dehydrogenase TIC 32, chloroplastic-like isoform X2 [Pyrus x bretschneideri]
MKAALEFVTSMEFWRMAVLWAFYLLISYWKLFLQPNSNSNSRPSNSSPWTSPSGFRPVCVITGATSGLGAAAAHALSARGFFVVLVGRSSHLLAKTIMDIKTQNENVHLKAFEVDVASFHSLLQFKASLQQWLSNSEMHPSIQLLINNAGILATSSRLTSQGYDQMMATNYLSAFSLSKLLLPLLRNSPVPSRIVNVTSFTHRSDPGVVETNIMREVPSCLSGLAFIVLKLLGLLQSPEIGVSSILDAALSPPETSGVYYFGGKGRTVDSSVLSYNAKLGEELWDASTHLFLESQLASKETFTSE